MPKVTKAGRKGVRATKAAGGAGSGSGRSQQQFTEPELRDISQRIETAVTPFTVPAGAIMMWPTSSIPAGWLECDGSAFDEVAYPELAAVLGTNTLPDLRGRAPVGAGAGTGLTDRALASSFGAESQTTADQQVTLTTNELPTHSHVAQEGGAHDHNFIMQVVQSVGGTGSSPRATGEQTGTGSTTLVTQQGGSHFHSASSAGAGNPFTVTGSSVSAMQPSVALKFIINCGPVATPPAA